MRLTARADAPPAMSMLNSWSRKTVRPSFSDSWNQSRQVMRLPVQLWKYSCATTLSTPTEVVVGGGVGAGQHVLGVEQVQPLVLHRAEVEVLDRDDHEAFQVQRQPEARLVPHHRGDQRVHRVLGLAQVGALDVDLQQVLAPGAGADLLLARHQVGGDQREQVAGLGEGVVPLGEVTRAWGRCPDRPVRPGCRCSAAPGTSPCRRAAVTV